MPASDQDRSLYVYYPGTSVVSNKIAPRVLNRPHSISATVDIQNGAEGVLVAQGSSSGGYTLYVKDHRLHYAYNFLGVQHFHVESDTTIGDGRHELRVEFEPNGAPDLAHGKGTPARTQLYIDGKLVGQTDLPVTIPLDIGITEGLTCGRDDGSTITTDYRAPFDFTGRLEKVVVDISGQPDRRQGRAKPSVMRTSDSSGAATGGARIPAARNEGFAPSRANRRQSFDLNGRHSGVATPAPFSAAASYQGDRRGSPRFFSTWICCAGM